MCGKPTTEENYITVNTESTSANKPFDLTEDSNGSDSISPKKSILGTDVLESLHFEDERDYISERLEIIRQEQDEREHRLEQNELLTNQQSQMDSAPVAAAPPAAAPPEAVPPPEAVQTAESSTTITAVPSKTQRASNASKSSSKSKKAKV